MKTIVLTGGPCAGKTTIMSHLIQSLEDRGYRVFVIPETPTELILNGIFPCEDILSDEFQKFVLDKQLMKENLYCKLDDYFNGKKAVILCDRGILDALAYIDKGKFLELLKDRQIYGLSDVWARYDGDMAYLGTHFVLYMPNKDRSQFIDLIKDELPLLRTLTPKVNGFMASCPNTYKAFANVFGGLARCLRDIKRKKK